MALQLVSVAQRIVNHLPHKSESRADLAKHYRQQPQRLLSKYL